MSAVSVKERPILFSGPMVRAILDGHKTQTRRVIKPQPASCAEGVYADLYNHGPEWAFWLPDKRMTEPRTWRCPYSQVRAVLWVREAWCSPGNNGDGKPIICYRSTGDPVTNGTPWKSPYHMRREHSRLTLKIVSIRVERLQEISEADAKAEGIGMYHSQEGKHSNPTPCYVAFPDRPGGFHTARAAFEMLWDSINAKRGFAWDENPWVWVIEFKRITR